MYILFRDKGITPGEYYEKSPGEKLLLSAFVRHMYPADEGKVKIIE